MTDADIRLARNIATVATPLHGAADDYDELLDSVGDAALVLIGEASHGTHELYRERAQITKRLIQEKGFVAVAAEADWPDAYRVNRFVRGRSETDEAIDALGDFRRFPQWMWRNADVLDFVGWLRSHNDAVPTRAAGFYGLDLYSLHASMQAVLAYLQRVDPRAAERARERYACFEDLSLDPQAYGYAASFDLTRACEDEAVAQLLELRRLRQENVMRDGYVDAKDEAFAAEQDARVVVDAERYYRHMFGGRVDTWNLRDTHMVDTLDALMTHLGRRGPAKIVVWAHNSHVGDARATQMGTQRQITVGQLVRERHPGRAVSIGLLTSLGTVSAASAWDRPVERKTILPPRNGSYEQLFSEVGLPRFFLDPRRFHGVRDALAAVRLERAIGVIYRPDTERLSHYFEARLPDQFDMVLHFDHTRAVEPLERTAEWQPAELPETYPSAL